MNTSLKRYEIAPQAPVTALYFICRLSFLIVCCVFQHTEICHASSAISTVYIRSFSISSDSYAYSSSPIIFTLNLRPSLRQFDSPQLSSLALAQVLMRGIIATLYSPASETYLALSFKLYAILTLERVSSFVLLIAVSLYSLLYHA